MPMKRGSGPIGGDLAASRLRLHHVSDAMPFSTGAEAVAFVAERRIAYLFGGGDLASLPNAICGRIIRGSWLKDPAVHAIYDILNAAELQACLRARLANGKWAVMASPTAAAFLAFATNPDRCARVLQNVSPPVAALYEQVQKQGRLPRRAVPAATVEFNRYRDVLERNFLVTSESEHTPSGTHQATLVSWRASRFGGRRTSHDSVETAMRTLCRDGLWSAVAATETEVARWFDGAALVLRDGLSSGDIVRLGTGRYLALRELRATLLR